MAAGRKLMVVACREPPFSEPCAVMHLPWVIACDVAAPSLVYLVLLVTVTGWVAPAVLTVMVSPATEATVPWMAGRFPGPVVGVPDGPGAGSPPCGHLPSTAGLTRTDAAVTGWSPCFPSLDRTLTQLPAVTSVSAAGVTSVTLVDWLKSTVAVPFC